MAAVSVRVPKASQAMTEGTVVEWFVTDGETVHEGQNIYRLETDKVEMDIEAPVSGSITILAAEGAAYPIGEEIARIETEG